MIRVALVVALTLAPGVAAAQTSTQQIEQEHKSPAETSQGNRDGDFATNSWLDGMAEVELGALAQHNAGDARVKEFGQRMTTDHAKANEQLGAIATGEQMSLPAQLDGVHASLKRKLSGMKGEAFDREYMNAMVDNHRMAVKSFELEAASGKDEALKAFATKTLPTLKEHLRMAEETQHAVVPPSKQRR